MGKEYTRAIAVLGNLPIAGQIVMSDDFEHLLHWAQYIGEGDSVFELDPSLAKQGNQSLYMKTRTTTSTEDDIIGITRSFHLLPSHVMTFLGSFRYPSRSVIKKLTILLNYYSGSRLRIPQIHFNPNTPSWELEDEAETPIAITNFDVVLSHNAWHMFILKVNFATSKYLSLQVDHLLADLSAYSFVNVAVEEPSLLSADVFIQTAGANPASINLDEFLIHEI